MSRDNDAHNIVAMRSPSPSERPPIPDAPGPRAQALINAFDKALENTLRRCSYDNFASCFPTPATYRRETLDVFWREFVGRLEGFCKSNFEQLLADRGIVPSLNDLHRLVDDAKLRRGAAETQAAAAGAVLQTPVPPHTLTPEALLSSHLAPFLEVEHERIQQQMTEVQQSNLDMLEEIQRQRTEMQRLMDEIAGSVADLGDSAEMMRKDEVQALTKTVRAIDVELRG